MRGGILLVANIGEGFKLLIALRAKAAKQRLQTVLKLEL